MWQHFIAAGTVLNSGGCFENEKYGDFRKLSNSESHFPSPNVNLCSLITLLGPPILTKNIVGLYCVNGLNGCKFTQFMN